MKLSQVFVAGGMPSVTYVDRDALHLERSLRREIAEGFKVICVTGPTKSGKTVLARRVLGPEKSITVEGGQIGSTEEFWRFLVTELDLPEASTKTSDQQASFGLNWLMAAQRAINNGETQSFSGANKKTVLRYIREQGLALVVDDFHYMGDDIQREIIRALKSEIFDGLIAVLIAVPHRAFDAIGVEREMEGRFANIDIPSWQLDDLVAIAKLGFPKLNMDVPQAVSREFAAESNGSPLLMQRFCGRLCVHYDITETQGITKTWNPSDDARSEIYSGVAGQFGLPTFQKLSRGPQSRSKRIDRRTADGSGSLDIYQAILRAVSLTGPKEKLHYNDIRETLKQVLVDGDLPAKHEVSAALGHMSGIAKDDIAGEPVLEWDDDYLYLTDPFLMFYMRWAQRPRGADAVME